MKAILDIKQLNKSNVDLAGGKGASLGEMAQAGILVPEGFVVLSSVYEEFQKNVEHSGSVHDERSRHSESSEQCGHSGHCGHSRCVGKIPEEIKNEILTAFRKLNTKYVAVRSSATAEDGVEHAWAGQLESYLYVTESNLCERIENCFASLNTPRALAYRSEKGLGATHVSLAVVVQKMIDSEKSGVAFSVHPVTENRNHILIEAGYGLGEAIVSGQITPDSYVVERETKEIVPVYISEQRKELVGSVTGGTVWRDILPAKATLQKLSEQEILELTETVLKLEKLYGFPCDIEWAYAGGKLYITQCRPITTLSSANA